jgi:type II restriction enzyme
VIKSSRQDDDIRIGINEFIKNANLLFNQLRAKRKESAFLISELEDFLFAIKCNSLKASSNKKTDINIIVHDAATGTAPNFGFSIKSQLGSASTLLNAGRSTNFIFKINGAVSSEVVNALEKIKDRIEAIESHATIKFSRIENLVFQNNLRLIDSCLPEILSQMLILYYKHGKSGIKEIADQLEQENPLMYDKSSNHLFYTYKIKRFLVEAALGMTPLKIWDGYVDATGGYLVVKSDGDIVCYHIYNRNQFEDYLLENTKLETASTTRHGFGKVMDVDGSQCLALNLQIRFKK